MEQEISIADIIRPLWLRKYELIVSIVLIAVLTSCSLYLILAKVNFDTKKYYHQDIKFNTSLNQKYIQLILDPDLLRKAYLENGLDPFNKGVEFKIINHSSRFDAMKEILLEDNIELLVKTLDIDQNKSGISLWETYLNFDTGYYQLVLTDKNLTDFESKIIITSVIKNYNLMINSNNFLKSKLFPEIAFNKNDKNLLYLNNRLQKIGAVLGEFEENFKENNFDAGETRYQTDVLMAHIYNMDPSPLVTNREELEQSILQNASLKKNLEELHSRFYEDDQGTGLTNTDTQLTVDSVSQLIDLGKDFSQLNNKKELIDTIYDIDLRISFLENSIFKLNSIQKLYLKNYKPISKEQIHEKTIKLINILNYNINLMNEKEFDNSVFTVGEIYIKQSKKFDTNIVLIVTLITLLYATLHIIFIYLRGIKAVK